MLSTKFYAFLSVPVHCLPFPSFYLTLSLPVSLSLILRPHEDRCRSEAPRAQWPVLCPLLSFFVLFSLFLPLRTYPINPVPPWVERIVLVLWAAAATVVLCTTRNNDFKAYISFRIKRTVPPVLPSRIVRFLSLAVRSNPRLREKEEWHILRFRFWPESLPIEDSCQALSTQHKNIYLSTQCTSTSFRAK